MELIIIIGGPKMDKRLKDLVDNYERMKIGLDDSFRFHCTGCGKCCINREDILLNPFDIYRISKDLGRTPSEVFKAYCEAFPGRTSHMMIVRLVPRGTNKACPFLRNKICAVHKVKPAVCALYPLGRTVSNGANGENVIANGSIQYLLQDFDCGSLSETHTVREWLSDFGIPAQDEFFMKWSQAVFDFGSMIKQIIDRFPDAAGKAMLSVLVALYLNYKTDEPFLPQFEENDVNLRELFKRGGIEPDCSVLNP